MDYPHWGRIYLAVILFAILVIVALWLFSEAYTPR